MKRDPLRREGMNGDISQYRDPLTGLVDNMTLNEYHNAARYKHLWEKQGDKVVFRNIWNKGSRMKNCMDFWCRRQRAVVAKAIEETFEDNTQGRDTEKNV